VIKKNLFLVALILFLNITSSGQDGTLNVRSITSISPSWPSETDLTFLDTLIKGKRIVLLGEETHFDGSSLMAKQRVINYLYKKGFNYLCIEHNFFEVNKAFRDIQNKKDSAIGALAFLTDVFPDIITLDNIALAKTIDQAHGQFRLAGLDIIPGSVYFNAFYQDFPAYMRRIVKYEQSPIRQHFEILGLKGYHSQAKMNRLISNPDKLNSAIENGQLLIQELGKLLMSLNNDADKQQLSFFIQQIKSLRSYYLYLQAQKSKTRPRENQISLYSLASIRDKQMADNFSWIYEHADTSARFMISLSSFHTGRNFTRMQPIPAEIDSSYKTVGDYLYEKFGSQCYSIAFIAYNGHRGRLMSDMENSYFSKPDNSFEYLLHKSGYPYAFLDMSSGFSWPGKKFLLHPTFEQPYYSSWNEHYDGLFFIDSIEPVKIKMIVNRINKAQPYPMPEGW
jgi:erythromycin esterase